MSTTIYCIADQYIRIQYPEDTDVLQRILPKYTPFVVDEKPSDRDFLLTIEVVPSLSVQDGAQPIESVKSYLHEAQVFKEADAYFLQIESTQALAQGRVSGDWHHLQLSALWKEGIHSTLIDRLIMIVFSMALLSLGYLKVHASVIELHGKALLFMGVSGTGKSTHSRLWLEHVPEATLLNDDEPFVRLCEDGIVRVYGCPWSGSTDCYRPISAEVVAFVHLYQASENILRPLNSREALSSLFSSSAFLLNEDWSRWKVFDSVSAILSRVKVFRLDNRPEKAAVDLTRSLIIE